MEKKDCIGTDVRVLGMGDGSGDAVAIVVAFRYGGDDMYIGISEKGVTFCGTPVTDVHSQLRGFSEGDARMIMGCLSGGAFGRMMIDMWGLSEGDFIYV